MALAFSNLDTDSLTNATAGFDAVTASVAITNNSVCFLLIVAAGGIMRSA